MHIFPEERTEKASKQRKMVAERRLELLITRTFIQK